MIGDFVRDVLPLGLAVDDADSMSVGEEVSVGLAASVLPVTVGRGVGGNVGAPVSSCSSGISVGAGDMVGADDKGDPAQKGLVSLRSKHLHCAGEIEKSQIPRPAQLAGQIDLRKVKRFRVKVEHKL